MAQGYSAEATGVFDGSTIPAGMSDGRHQGGRVRAYVATFDLSLAAVKKANGDTNVCFRLPAGCKPLYGYSLGSATMGANATVAIGNADTPGKYRAAATHTTANAPQFFMLSSALDDAPLAADEDVIITVGHADGLPGAGIFQVVMFASAR